MVTRDNPRNMGNEPQGDITRRGLLAYRQNHVPGVNWYYKDGDGNKASRKARSTTAMSTTETTKRTRKTQKPFLLPRGFNCPAADCKVTGSIPGLKRHLQKAHGWTKAEADEWAAELTGAVQGGNGTTAAEAVQDEPTEPEAKATTAVDFSELKADTLRQLAKEAGIAGWHSMKKAELAEALAG
jgi:hypothetical protein